MSTSTLRRSVRGRPITRPNSHYNRIGRLTYHERVARMIRFVGGDDPRCAFCEMSNLDHWAIYGTDLELDHVDPFTKSFNPKARWSYRFEGLVDELLKCQLLCRRCHVEKTG